MKYQLKHIQLRIFNYSNYLFYCKIAFVIFLLISILYQNEFIEQYKIFKVIIFVISVYNFYEYKLRFEILIFNNFSRSKENGFQILFFGFYAVLFNPLLPVDFIYDSVESIFSLIFIYVLITSLFDLPHKNTLEYIHWHSALIIFDLKLNDKLTTYNLHRVYEDFDTDNENNSTDLVENINIGYFLFSKAIELEPLKPRPYFYRGLLCIKNNWSGETIDDLRAAIKLGETNQYINLYLGLTLLTEAIILIENKPHKKGFETEYKSLIQYHLSESLELFVNQIQINNNSMAYFFLTVIFTLLTDESKKSKISRIKDIKEISERVLKKIEPDGVDINNFISGKLKNYRNFDIKKKVFEILKHEDKNYMK